MVVVAVLISLMLLPTIGVQRVVKVEVEVELEVVVPELVGGGELDLEG